MVILKNKMLLTTPRGKFVEKIVRDASGRLVRASFCVYENEGHIKARLLNVVYLKCGELANKIFKLGTSKNSQSEEKNISYRTKIVSPYYDFNTLYFFGSKPRAPSL